MMKVLMLFVIVLPLAGCSESVVFKINVHDEEGKPVTNAVVNIKTLKRLVGVNVKPNDYRWIKASSDTNGVVTVKFDLVSTNFRYWLTADGYYSLPFHEVGYRMKKDHLIYVELAEHEKEESIILRKVSNPIPMFGYGSPSWLGEKLPIHGEYGFDMMAGDFIAPYGKGNVPDFFIRKNYDNKSRDGKSALFFKGKGNGAYKIKAFTDSEFRSCYVADTNAAFKTEFRHEYIKEDKEFCWREVCDVNEDECLVLRTRCRYDEKGNLVSCHYSKIYGKIEIRSYFQFRGYAFNSMPNDPNLEFDVKQNLLKKDTAPYLP